MSTEMTKKEAAALSIVPHGNIAEIISENLGGGISAMDLDRVKIPSGGGIAWEVPSLEGSEMAKTLEGVIIYHMDTNAYWPDAIDDGAHVPPACVSRNGRMGLGTPGGMCATCALNQFGTDSKKGRGKACKNMKMLFVLQPGKLLPLAILLPPTSIPPVKKYLLQLTSEGMPFYGVKSKLSLVKDKNADGTEFSKLAITPIVLNDGANGAARLLLPADTIAEIKAYRDALIPVLQQVQIDAADVAAEPDTFNN